MYFKFATIAAAAILTGCCSCPQPCPSLVNNPNGCCPCCDDGKCGCAASYDITDYTVPANGCAFGYSGSDVKAYWLRADPVCRAKTADGYVQVQIPVWNLTVSPMKLKYRFRWLGKGGNVVKDLDHNHWESISIVPGGDARISSIAPELDCNDYELHIRYVP